MMSRRRAYWRVDLLAFWGLVVGGVFAAMGALGVPWWEYVLGTVVAVVVGYLLVRMSRQAPGGLLDPAVTEPGALETSPAVLIRARSGVVPYSARPGLLEELVGWVGSEEPFAACLIGGPGGTGKTRLGVELCVRAEGEKWMCGFLPPRADEAAFENLAQVPKCRLVVIDYAESHTKQLEVLLPLLRERATAKYRIRVLLLVRAAPPPGGNWTVVLRTHDAGLDSVLNGLQVRLLEEVPLEPAERRKLFSETAAAFAARSGPAATLPPEPPDVLTDALYANPLLVVIAAYEAVQRGGALPGTRDQLLDRLLAHEEEYWKNSASDLGLRIDEDPTLAERVVAMATLATAKDEDQAAELLRLVADLVHATDERLHALARWASDLYPHPGPKARWWNPLEPDIVGEHLVAKCFSGYPGVLTGVLDRTGRDAADRPLDVCARAAHHYPSLTEALVEEITDHETDAGLAEALKVASVSRRHVNAVLLERLLSARRLLSGRPAVTAEEAARLVDAMRERYAFVSTVEPDRPGAIELCIHEAVRVPLDARLRTEAGTEAYEALHRAAATYYYEQLRSEEGPWTYGTWFVYEDVYWQVAKREWTYHIAWLRDRLEEARLQFAYLFLDGFWWWGSYTHFEFCRQIVDDIPAREGYEDIAGALGTIQAKYPTGYEKPPGPHWKEVRSALEALEVSLGLHDQPLPGTEDERHVKALIEVFLADSWRFDDVHAPEADGHYDAAVKLFTEDSDDWNLGWMAYEQGDLAMARGAVETSLGHCADAAAKAYLVEPGPERDEELIANIHRVVADCLWKEGDVPAAFDSDVRSVVHAYLFHAVGGPPDGYTRLFHMDMVGHCIAHLRELWSRDRDLTERMVERIDALSAVLRRGERPPGRSPLQELAAERWEDLEGLLFPRAPLPVELGREDSDFMTTWKLVAGGLGQGVHEDLQDIVERRAAAR